MHGRSAPDRMDRTWTTGDYIREYDMRRASIISAFAIAAVPLVGTGCVQQDRYDAILESNRSLKEQLVSAEDERDVSRANLDTVRQELSQSRSDLARLQQQNSALRGDLDEMSTGYDDLLTRVSDLKVGPLPRDVESALTSLARNHPELLTFDAQTGMVRFASDFTFDLGSATVRSGAAQTLGALAEILNTPSAQQFEVRIVGHTDNVPIGKPSTRAKHPTNMHLSVHRAIAVRDQLTKAGVEPVRMQVAGYGSYRPIVANGTNGAAENRRVELYLAPLTESVMDEIRMTASPNAAKTNEPTRRAGVEPNK